MNELDIRFKDLPIDRNLDQFLGELIQELASTLEDVVGLDEAKIFISAVGTRIGNRMNDEYREATQSERLDIEQIAATLVDLKRRIKGGFSIEAISEKEIVLVNTRCPFGDRVIGLKSLCMMTSNVFGRITADNYGYAKVNIEKSIASGDKSCRVIISLKPDDKPVSLNSCEYFSKD